MSTSYDRSYFDNTYGIGSSGWWSMRAWSTAFHSRVCKRLLLKRPAGERTVLEVGCGPGENLARLAPSFPCTGIDTAAPEILEECRRRVPEATVLPGNLDAPEGIELPAESFDLILAKYVLEHLRCPDRALHWCARTLRRGGVLYLVVPDLGGYLRARKGKHWHAYGDPTHCSILWPDEWLHLSRAAGLEPVTVFADGFWDAPYLPWLPAPLQRLLGMSIAAPQVLSGVPVLPAHWGENLLVIAKKA